MGQVIGHERAIPVGHGLPVADGSHDRRRVRHRPAASVQRKLRVRVLQRSDRPRLPCVPDAAAVPIAAKPAPSAIGVAQAAIAQAAAAVSSTAGAASTT